MSVALSVYLSLCINAGQLLVFNSQGCRGYGDSHGDSHGYGFGMGMGTVMNPHGFCGDSVGIFEWM